MFTYNLDIEKFLGERSKSNLLLIGSQLKAIEPEKVKKVNVSNNGLKTLTILKELTGVNEDTLLELALANLWSGVNCQIRNDANFESMGNNKLLQKIIEASHETGVDLKVTVKTNV